MKDALKYGIWMFMLGMVIFPGILQGQPLPEDMPATCDNYLYISGESNVNQFSFTYNSDKPKKSEKGLSYNENIEINIPIKEFEASNPLMYNDFLQLMKESEHPEITVSFSKKQLQIALQNASEPCPEIRITIAGITKIYNIECSLAKCSGNLYLKGDEVVRLSDFKLKPPAKLLGLVKVNNEITVNFGFIITFTGNNSISATL